MNYIYLLFDKSEVLHGAYVKKSEAYERALSVFKSINVLNDELYDGWQTNEPEYWGNDKVNYDWSLYKIPIGNILLDTRYKHEEFSVELPEFYEDIKINIRELKIEEITN